MSSKTGKDWVIARYEGSDTYGLGGKIVNCKKIKHAENSLEAETGTRKTSLSTSGIYWELNIKMKVQKLGDFINTYAFVTAEGTLPSFNLYVSDGIDKKGYSDCLVDKCQINIKQSGAITAEITVIAKNVETKDLTVTPSTETPMTKTAVTEHKIGGVSVQNWIDISFSVENHVQKISSGNGLTVSDVYAKEATYSLEETIIKKATLQFDYDTTTSKTVEISLTDNQATPVTKKYTFQMDVSTNSSGVEELDITQEEISAVGNSLVIS
jgi:hypothetical protein